MAIVLIYFYLQHLKIYCLFLFETRDRPSIDSTAVLCWWAPVRAKQLSMAATARVIWLCAYVRYWPDRGVDTCTSVLKLVLKSILVRVSARFELARVRVIRSQLYHHCLQINLLITSLFFLNTGHIKKYYPFPKKLKTNFYHLIYGLSSNFHYQVATTAVNNILPSLLKKH